MLSRGQTKILIIGLIAALAKHIQNRKRTSPILLIDDLASELDQQAKITAIQLLTAPKTQAIFTAIAYNALTALFGNETAVFHVKQGRIH